MYAVKLGEKKIITIRKSNSQTCTVQCTQIYPTHNFKGHDLHFFLLVLNANTKLELKLSFDLQDSRDSKVLGIYVKMKRLRE